MKVLVIGGSGYIGKEIVKELEKQNYTPTILSRNPKGKNTIQCSLLNKEKLKRSIKDYGVIINLASILRTPKKSKFRENVQGLKNLIDVMDKQKLIYFSTINVHINKAGYYGTSKKQCEALLKDSDCIILRPNNVYGIDKENDVYRLIKIIKTFRIYPSIGSGKTKIQPIHKEDLAKITVDLIKNFKPQIFDVSGSEQISFNEMAKLTNKKYIKLRIPLFLLKMIKKIVPFDVDGFTEDRVGKVSFKLQHSIKKDIEEIKGL